MGREHQKHPFPLREGWGPRKSKQKDVDNGNKEIENKTFSMRRGYTRLDSALKFKRTVKGPTHLFPKSPLIATKLK